MIEIILNSKPVALRRPRFVRKGLAVEVYNSQRRNMNAAYWDIREQYLGDPITVPLDVQLQFVYKGKGNGHKRTRPDLDNLIKYILDAANGLLWVDDSIICKLTAEKIYGKEDQIIIRIKELKDENPKT